MSSETQENEQEDKTYPFLIDYLPDEYQRKAEIELNETTENSVQLLEKLKQMTKSEDDINGIEFHDDFLRQFLRQSKYDVNRSLKRLRDFIKFKKENNVIFRNIDMEKVSKTPDYKFATPLPWRCRDGCSIMICEYSKWDPSGIALEDLIRISIMIHQQSLRNPLTQINGYKMIVDWKDSRLSQLKYTNPKFLFMAYQALIICTPARMKEVHFVNESAVMKAIWALFKPFLPEKIKNRVYFQSSPEDLLKHFPKHTLPVQYGGDLENYYMEDWIIEANEQTKLCTLGGQCNTF